MDDQNIGNQPLVPGTDPVVPSVPLDITPTDVPAPTPPMEVPTPEPPTPPAEVTPLAPWTNPEPVSAPAEATPLSTPLPTPTEPATASVEPPMPTGKPKNKLMPIIGGVVALLLVVGVAGAAYYVSNQLSSNRALAPNAPASKPMALVCGNVGTANVCGLAGGCPVGSRCLQIDAEYECRYYSACPQPTATAIPCTTSGCIPLDAGSCCTGSSQVTNYSCTSRKSCVTPTATAIPCTTSGCIPLDAGSCCTGSSQVTNYSCTSRKSCVTPTAVPTAALPACTVPVTNCSTSSLIGSSVCTTIGHPTGWNCCPVTKVPVNGSCVLPTTLPTCTVPTENCLTTYLSNSIVCKDSSHPNGWNCCPEGMRKEAGACVDVPPCASSLNCSTASVTGATFCDTPSHPDGWYCCTNGKVIVGGVCVNPPSVCSQTSVGGCGAIGGCDIGKKCTLNQYGEYACLYNATCTQPTTSTTVPTTAPVQVEGAVCLSGYTDCGSPYMVANTCVKTCKVGTVSCWINATGCTVVTGVCSRDAGSGAATSCYKTTTASNVCETSPFTFGCGMECCNTAYQPVVCCCMGCFPAGTDCSLHACAPSATCDLAKRDTPASKSITFAKTGKVHLFTRNADGGTVTLTGPKTVTIQTATGIAVENPTTFQVTAGETYTIKLKLSSPRELGKDAYGWIPNKSENICGPVKTPGLSVTGSDPTGKCGEEKDISAVRTLALKTDLTGITAGATNANIQCWGDAEIGDATQDYDFNDVTLIFGYEKSVDSECKSKYFCNTSSYSCIATTGTYYDLKAGQTDFISCINSKPCAENLALDVARPDTGVCYATLAACQTGCVAPQVGACVQIKIYKKVNGVYGTIPLTTAQLQALKIGDVLKFTLDSSMKGLSGRFRVTIGSTAGSWLTGTIDATNSKLVTYSDYTIETPGQYKFEAQVSILPENTTD